MKSYFKDVGEFHEKFGLPAYPDATVMRLTSDLAKFRVEEAGRPLLVDRLGFDPKLAEKDPRK